MMLHAGEIWIALAVSLLLGCLLGSLIERALATTRLARHQAALALGVDRVLAAIRWRLFPWRGKAPVPMPAPVEMHAPTYGLVVAEQGEILPHDLPAPPAEAPPAEAPQPVGRPADNAKRREAIARADAAGTRPLGLPEPRNGGPDPIAGIAGVGKRHAARLNSVGIFHFSQIAAWTPAEAAWIGAFLGNGEAVTAKNWIEQAIRLAAGEPAAAAQPEAEPQKPAPKKSARNGRTNGKRKAKSVPAPDGQAAVEHAMRADAPSAPVGPTGPATPPAEAPVETTASMPAPEAAVGSSPNTGPVSAAQPLSEAVEEVRDEAEKPVP